MLKRFASLCLVILFLFVSVNVVEAEIADDLEEGYKAFRRGDYDKAVEMYTEVLKNRTLTGRDRAVTFLLRGEARKEKGEDDKAIADFTRALQIRSNYHQALYMRGLVHEKQGKYLEAFKDIRQASDIVPDNKTYKEKREIIKAKLTSLGIEIPRR